MEEESLVSAEADICAWCNILWLFCPSTELQPAHNYKDVPLKTCAVGEALCLIFCLFSELEKQSTWPGRPWASEVYFLATRPVGRISLAEQELAGSFQAVDVPQVI